LVEFFLAGLTILIVQMYFIHTIWRFLTNRRWQIPLTISVALLSLLSFSGGTASVYEFTLNSGVAASLKNAAVTASIQTVTAFVADIYIAVALSVILYGKKTGFMRTDSLVAKLVAFSIHRGIFTALMQLLHFATFIGTLPYGSSMLIWSLFHFPGSKIYVNSLLALLNVRQYLRDGPDLKGDVALQEIVATERRFHKNRGPKSPTLCLQTRIIVETEVLHDVDESRMTDTEISCSS